jgi:hypothetical protein
MTVGMSLGFARRRRPTRRAYQLAQVGIISQRRNETVAPRLAPHDPVTLRVCHDTSAEAVLCSAHHQIPRETAMAEIDDISARLTVLETVVRQLITHLAVRAEDPMRWVETRKVLALSAIAGMDEAPVERVDRINDAVADFFDQAELVAAEYGPQAAHGTHGPFMR